MKKLKAPYTIVADENIPQVAEAFSHIGEVRLLPGRAIGRRALLDADLLLVRSVTPVHADLLRRTPVRFVGTATIGTDHVDTEYLRDRGIAFASAAGSNANSVTEYVMAALLYHAVQHGLSLRNLTLGVVGSGHIGARVAGVAAALGMQVLLNDPPLARQTRDPRYLPLDALMEADILTLHTPLSNEGEDATFHLFDRKRLFSMKPGAVLMNTARGPVVDHGALREALQAGHLSGAILDVWENEPDIDGELMRLAEVGTPHIAGYSLDGKLNGTDQIYLAACAFLGVAPQWHLKENLPPVRTPIITVQTEGVRRDEEILHQAIQHAFNIRADDERLRACLNLPFEERGAYFDRLRRDYPVRREFWNYEVRSNGGNPSVMHQLKALGFRVGQPP